MFALAILSCIAYLAIMGDLRRLLPTPTESLDPFLLIGPAMTGMILLRLLFEGSIRFDTPISKLVAVLIAVMAVEAFNPKQGSLVAGFAGAVLYVVPLLWFFIAKAVGDQAFTRKMVWYVILPISTAGALLGTYQTFVGFPRYEYDWVKNSGYVALSVGRIRPFGFFVSAAEYTLFLGIGAIILIALMVGRKLRWSLILLPLLLMSLFLESSRGAIVMLVAAACAMWGATARTNAGAMIRMLLALGLMGAVIINGLSRINDVDLPDNVRVLYDHTKKGLLDPMNSSAGGHLDLIKTGLVSAIKSPFGEGLGSTIAASRSGRDSKGTEFDISDMFVCLGLAGVLYGIMVFACLRRAVLHFRQEQTVTSLAIVGILILTLGNWIMGSLYAAAPLICFFLGSIDHQPDELAESRARAGVPTATPADSCRWRPTPAYAGRLAARVIVTWSLEHR